MSKFTQLFKPNIASNENNFFKGYALCLALLSGILIGTSYVPLPPWAVGFCYLPLWYSLVKSTENNFSYKFIFTLGWITQFILTLIGFNWIYFTATEFGQMPAVVSLLGLLLFATFIHIYIPIALTLAVWLKRKFKISIVKFIFVMALLQILSERVWPSIFEWNLGYTFLWMRWPLAQWADTVGFWGLSSWIFIFQASLLSALFLFNKRFKISLGLIFALFFSVSCLWIIGGHKHNDYLKQTDAEVQIAIVQANISNEDKIQSEKGSAFQSFILQEYFEETEKVLASSHPDFVVWPETALPIALDKDYYAGALQQRVLNRVNTWQTHLITGAYSQDTVRHDHLGNRLIRNSVFFLKPQAGIVATEEALPYFKTDLLIFGEYLPFGKEFPFLYKLFPFVGVYEKGPGPVRKELQNLKSEKVIFGSQICYESLNIGFSRGLAKMGAEIFFNLTNDSWFGSWAEPYQHMIMTLGRGLENRRPLIRSTNTGISTVILASGDILEQSPVYKKWSKSFKIPYTKNPPLSFYTEYGHHDGYLYLLILILILGASVHATRKKS